MILGEESNIVVGRAFNRDLKCSWLTAISDLNLFGRRPVLLVRIRGPKQERSAMNYVCTAWCRSWSTYGMCIHWTSYVAQFSGYSCLSVPALQLFYTVCTITTHPYMKTLLDPSVVDYWVCELCTIVLRQKWLACCHGLH
jgi:hypothetical protein